MNPSITMELEGWELFFAELEPTHAAEAELAALRTETACRTRERLKLETLSEQPVVSGLRKLFRRAGCDPTRYRAGSEALLRRLLKGEEMPAVHPLVDLGNCLAAELAANVCVMDADRAAPPFVLRAGRAGETMLSLRGPFDLEGKPVLFDTVGPADVPIAGADRVRVTQSTRRAWLIAYLPAGITSSADVSAALDRLVARAPVARPPNAPPLVLSPVH